MEKLLAFIKSWFGQKSYGEDLEEYVRSHHPSSPGQVEQLVRNYDRKQKDCFPYY